MIIRSIYLLRSIATLLIDADIYRRKNKIVREYSSLTSENNLSKTNFNAKLHYEQERANKLVHSYVICKYQQQNSCESYF